MSSVEFKMTRTNNTGKTRPAEWRWVRVGQKPGKGGWVKDQGLRLEDMQAQARTGDRIERRNETTQQVFMWSGQHWFQPVPDTARPAPEFRK